MESASHFYKFLLDENLSYKLVSKVEDIFPGSTHVSNHDLLKTSDKIIWNFALARGYCILTRDWDYKFISVTSGCPPKVVRLNCSNKATIDIYNLIYLKQDIIKEFLNDKDICYLEIE